MSMELCLHRAAQAWCTEKTKHKEMDSELAYEFAVILNEIWSQAWLGNATTGELLSEVRTRIELDGRLGYRTVDGE